MSILDTVLGWFGAGKDEPTPQPQNPHIQFRQVEYIHRSTIVKSDVYQKIMQIINRDDILGRDDLRAEISRALGSNRILGRDDLLHVLSIINRDDFITPDELISISQILGRDDIIGRDDLINLFQILGRDDIIGRDDILGRDDYSSPSDLKYQQRSDVPPNVLPQDASTMVNIAAGQQLPPQPYPYPNQPPPPDPPAFFDFFTRAAITTGILAGAATGGLIFKNTPNIPRGLPSPPPQVEDLPELEPIYGDDPDKYITPSPTIELEIIYGDDPEKYITPSPTTPIFIDDYDPCAVFDDLNMEFMIWDNDSCTTDIAYSYYVPGGVPEFDYTGSVGGKPSDCNVFANDPDYVVCYATLPFDYGMTNQEYVLNAATCEEPADKYISYVPLFEKCSSPSGGDPEPGITPESPGSSTCASSIDNETECADAYGTWKYDDAYFFWYCDCP